ncbi:hypothetical protein MTR_4g031955 [Medicago truncatula]|uniref:Uncharacterized protein n=1 Tax=Medicago truncatula TaxID=3880 RepID=A0A072UII8_MEDTR|nr:hypothetical protein MTR_4g031955 [Medicago truncatula]
MSALRPLDDLYLHHINWVWNIDETVDVLKINQSGQIWLFVLAIELLEDPQRDNTYATSLKSKRFDLHLTIETSTTRNYNNLNIIFNNVSMLVQGFIVKFFISEEVLECESFHIIYFIRLPPPPFIVLHLLTP